LTEVETTWRGIAPHIQGKKVADVVLRQTRLRWQVNPNLAEILAGQGVWSWRPSGSGSCEALRAP